MRKTFVAGLMFSVVAFGCRASHPPPATTQPATQPTTRPADRLVGTWVTEKLDPRSGDLQIKLVFTKRPHEKLLSWSELPMRGLARTSESPFTATDETIESSALASGRPTAYRFDEAGKLLIRRPDGIVVTFHRVK